MTLNLSATLATVPPCPQDAVPHQPSLGELPVGAVQKVGDYKVLGILGTGGMGIVYKAFDQKLGRIVALKMLQVGVEAGPEEILRFRGEAESLGRLQHPNIVQVFDFGMHDKSPYLVMEYVNGGALDKKLSGTPQPPRKAAELLELLARAVHAAHEAKVVHRDLKPANVLLTAEGSPKITDFGLAKQTEVTQGLTQTGAIMGTPSYMAPEQAQGKKEIGPAADIYSLGAILYECLTGRPPFRGATLQETLEQVCVEDPAPPSRLVPRLPRDLQTICLKCLHKSPTRRYESAADLADDLRNWMDGLPVNARPTHSIERLFRVVARKPLRAALVLAGALVVVLMVVLLVVIREKDNEKQRMELENEAREQKRLGEDKAREQKQQQERYALDKKNFEDLLGLALQDLNSTTGVARLTDRLEGETGKLRKQREAGADVKLKPLAQFYFQLVPRVWKRGTGHREAIDLLDRAVGMLQDDLKHHPEDSDARFLLARVYSLRGKVRTDEGGANAELSSANQQLAEKDFADSLRELSGLRGERGDRHEFLRVRGQALHNRGVLLSKVPARSKDALAAYLDALADRQRLVAGEDATEQDRRDLARTFGYLGDLHRDRGEVRDADRTYWASHRLREKSARDNPKDYEAQFQLARSWWNFGNSQRLLGSLDTSLHFHEEARKILDVIHAKQPDNQTYSEDLAIVLNRIAELDLLTGGLDSGRLGRVQDLLARGEKLLVELLAEAAASSRASIGLRSAAAENLALKARAFRLAGKPKETWEAQVASIAYLKERVSGGDNGTVKYANDVTPGELYTYAALMALFAEPEHKRDQLDRARESLRQSLSRGYARLHPDDIARDRAFLCLQKDEKFSSILADYRKKSDPATGTAIGGLTVKK